MTEQLVVDDLAFEVRRSSRRKTVELIVDRGGELRIVAPAGVAVRQLEGFVREKRFWLYTKLAEKEALQRPSGSKEFATGEGLPYLGRSYRVLLVDEQDEPLKLKAGRFCLLRSATVDGWVVFTSWYSRNAAIWLRRRVGDWAPRMSAKPTAVEVRDLGFRWGSCGKGGKVHFHWATILLPPTIIDYVIVHELAHLHEPKHTRGFWQQVERAMPDYEERRRWLAERGGGLVVL